jgi:hypothetical protein
VDTVLRSAVAEPAAAPPSVAEQPELGAARRATPRAWARYVSETLRVGVVAAAGIFAVQPLLQGWFGAADQRWYLTTLYDFVVQARAGVFPATVGQTEFSYNGLPIAKTLLLFYLGAALDTATWHTLDAVQLLYWTVALSMVAGGLATYITLGALYPRRRSVAAFAAVFFVLSPAILAPIYVLDMVPTIVILPYIPVLVYGIVRFVRLADAWSCVLIAASLSLILVSHALVALWCALFVVIALVPALVIRWRRWAVVGRLAASGLLFLALSAWYIVPLVDLHLDSDPTFERGEAAGAGSMFMSQPMVQFALAKVQAWSELQLSPIVVPGIDSLQLGYALWLLIGLAVVQVIRRKVTLELGVLLVVILGFLVYLFPVPSVTELAYRLLPFPFEETLVPQQRLYIPFAAFAAAIGVCAVSGWSFASRIAKVSGVLFVGVFAVAAGWSLSQAQLFTDYAQQKMEQQPDAVSEAEGSLLLGTADSVRLNLYNVKTVSSYSGPVGYSGTDFEYFEPALDNALVDDVGLPALVRSRDGLGQALQPGDRVPSNIYAAVSQASATPAVPIKNHRDPDHPDNKPDFSLGKDPISPETALFTFEAEPQKSYLITYEADLDNSSAYVMMKSPAHLSYSVLAPPGTRGSMVYDEVDQIRGAADSPMEVLFIAQLACTPEAPVCHASLHNFRVGTYDPATLPIHLESLFPYRADVTALVDGYLETHRMFVPGYQATVNGTPVDVRESLRGRVEVPVPAGASTVALNYAPTLASQVSRWLSLIVWLAVAAAIASRWVTRATWKRFRGGRTNRIL